MSVYKPKASPHYHYDFQLRNRRFCGSTGRAQKHQAREVEKTKRREAAALLDREAAQVDPVSGAPRLLGAAVLRYFHEVGRHHANAETTLTDLERLTTFFGAERALDSIGDRDVAELVAWRRSQRVKDRTTAPFVSPTTVNRSTIQVLRKVFNRALEVWDVAIPRPPKWRQHMLVEPRNRVREVRASEEELLDALREDYHSLRDFARASGLRMASCLLRKSEVDLRGGKIHTHGKGGKPIIKPITTEMRAILMAEMVNPTDWVFTYVARRAFDPARPPGGKRRAGAAGRVTGDRVPITIAGLKTAWRRARTGKKPDAPTLPADLRFHDLRHDFATKLLRATGNLRLTQIALDHSRVETTTRYAQVLDADLLAGMEAASRMRRLKPKNPEENPEDPEQDAKMPAKAKA